MGKPSPALTTVSWVWWLDPPIIFACTIGITLVVAVVTPSEVFRQLGTPKYVEGWHLGLGVFGIAAFIAGVRLSSLWPVTHSTPLDSRWDARLQGWFYVATGLSLAGYVVWTVVGVAHGFNFSLMAQMIWSSDEGVADMLKNDVLKTVPGITTLSQLGPVAALLGSWLALRRVPRVLPLLVLVFLFTFARAFFRSERLALIELVVPSFVLVLRVLWVGQRVSPWWSSVLRGLPVLGVLALFLLFGSFEFFRSWQYYRERTESYAQFAMNRFAGYYTTAHNNGAMAVGSARHLPLPYFTLQSYWQFPLIVNSPLSYQSITGIDPDDFCQRMYDRYGAGEFNNEGGLFAPYLDFGLTGFAVFFLLYGWLVGGFYRGFLSGSFMGVIGYPILFLSILDLPRIVYVCETRAFPILVMLALLGYDIARRAAKERSAHRTGGSEEASLVEPRGDEQD